MNLRDIAHTSSGIYALVEVDDHEFWVQEGTELADYKVLSIREMNVYLKHSSDDSETDENILNLELKIPYQSSISHLGRRFNPVTIKRILSFTNSKFQEGCIEVFHIQGH